jgi:hypothetical protein
MCVPSKKVFLLNYFSTKYAFQAKSITYFSLALLVPTNIVSVFTVTSGKAEMLKMAHTFEIGRTKLDLLDLINNSSIVYEICFLVSLTLPKQIFPLPVNSQIALIAKAINELHKPINLFPCLLISGNARIYLRSAGLIRLCALSPQWKFQFKARAEFTFRSS